MADRVRDAVLAVPGVADLHGGAFGEVATYLAGRVVKGVQLRRDAASVHVVLNWNTPARPTAQTIRAAVEPIVGTPVDVVVEDYAPPS